MASSVWDMLREYFGHTWQWPEEPTDSAFDVPRLMHHFSRLPSSGRKRLARRICDLMLTAQPRDWIHLYPIFKLIDFKPADVRTLEALESSLAVEMIGIASLNRNGRVREQAVRALGDMNLHRAVPYLLLRLADWVQPVRLAADQSLFQVLAKDSRAEILHYARLIWHLQRIGRVDLSEQRRRILQHLRRPELRPATETWLAGSDRLAKLLIYEALEDQLEQHSSLIDRALSDPDVAIRIWIAGWLAQQQSTPLHHLRRLIHDRDARVATQTVRRLSPAMTQAVRDELLENLSATQRTIRQASRFVLREHAMTDVREHYLVLLRRGAEVRAGAVAGLGETGRPEDFDHVAVYATSPQAQMRQAAIEAMARLAPERASNALIEALDDSNGKVRRVAIAFLQDRREDDLTARILQMIRTASPRGQIAAFRTVAGRASWDAVPALLLGVSSPNEELQTQAWTRLAAWLRRHFVWGWIKPTSQTWSHVQAIWTRDHLHTLVPPAEHNAAWQRLEQWIKEVAASARG